MGFLFVDPIIGPLVRPVKGLVIASDSEAIQNDNWIASSLALLAMT
jgi:hypothetical protein